MPSGGGPSCREDGHTRTNAHLKGAGGAICGATRHGMVAGRSDKCVGCDIVQADHAPDGGVAQGIFHGILVRHHGRIQEEVEEGLEKEVERQEEEDNTQEQVRMTMTMDEMERHCEALEPM